MSATLPIALGTCVRDLPFPARLALLASPPHFGVQLVGHNSGNGKWLPLGNKAAVDQLDGVPGTQSGSRMVAKPPPGGGEASEPIEKIGGPCRTRTYDPLIKSQLLYQLS
jgi:hypothetical protein